MKKRELMEAGRSKDIVKVKKLKQEGLSNAEISKKMNIKESIIRRLAIKD